MTEYFLWGLAIGIGVGFLVGVVYMALDRPVPPYPKDPPVPPRPDPSPVPDFIPWWVHDDVMA